jgi:hypothetical protein
MAQLVEQLTLNQWVPGSSPGGCTDNGESGSDSLFLFFLEKYEG